MLIYYIVQHRRFQHQLAVTLKVFNAIKAFNAISVKFMALFMAHAARKFNQYL